MSNSQKAIQDNKYKVSLTLLGPYQNIILNYGFPNHLTHVPQKPNPGLLLNGVQISEQYYKNNSNIIYIFGYPINIYNPNGCMLYKISQLSDFKMDIHFARLFVILYIKHTYKEYGFDTDPFQNFSEMDCKLALYQLRIFHKILPQLVIKEQMQNGVIKFVYQVGNSQYVGSSSDIVVQVAQDYQQECETWFEKMKQEAGKFPYTKEHFGYSVPEYNIYQEYLQKKESALKNQNEYTRNCIKNSQEPNYYFISAIQLINISNSELQNVEISQKIELLNEKQHEEQQTQEKTNTANVQ